ncbi:unnamed protein product [Didymodactylos carnosus]|uniref:nicotinamidase n=1 Tax=Didymodactylos carnosus TaxID=1234261 RepID=A0A8S2IFW8_9BILA|nr:unnamed protein product [Didymodactylos carnosus]CAF3751121.1 unnamed protein product [Didymodactylos carnosus]
MYETTKSNEKFTKTSKMLIEKATLIIIDVQNDFVENGSLAIPNGSQIISIINKLRELKLFELIVLTQDWHCRQHVSFASAHLKSNPNTFRFTNSSAPGALPFITYSNLNYTEHNYLCNYNEMYTLGVFCGVNRTEIQTNQIIQQLWPDHCVENTHGAQFVQELNRKDTDELVRHGDHCHSDSYSIFTNRYKNTRLNEILRLNKITDVYLVGFAFDYAVWYSSMDAIQFGYKTIVIQDVTRSINKSSQEKIVQNMKQIGIEIINSTKLLMEVITLPSSVNKDTKISSTIRAVETATGITTAATPIIKKIMTTSKTVTKSTIKNSELTVKQRKKPITSILISLGNLKTSWEHSTASTFRMNTNRFRVSQTPLLTTDSNTTTTIEITLSNQSSTLLPSAFNNHTMQASTTQSTPPLELDDTFGIETDLESTIIIWTSTIRLLINQSVILNTTNSPNSTKEAENPTLHYVITSLLVTLICGVCIIGLCYHEYPFRHCLTQFFHRQNNEKEYFEQELGSQADQQMGLTPRSLVSKNQSGGGSVQTSRS